MTLKVDGTNGVLQAYDYQTPTTGFSYTFAAGTTVLVMNPAGTLATGTITMPASPADGMTITFSSTKQITALTLNGNTGQTVVSGVTFLPANQATTYVYRLSNTTWYPMSTVATNVPATPAGGSIITSGTAVASTSGTSIDFTSIPSWVKRITIAFQGVSTNGSSVIQIQIGAGSVASTGYLGAGGYIQNAGASAVVNFTTGFGITGGSSAASIYHGFIVITLIGSNQWIANGAFGRSDAGVNSFTQGSISLGGILDRVRITTVNGTDTFDAGSINILYE
jgi:hypothetical protein